MGTEKPNQPPLPPLPDPTHSIQFEFDPSMPWFVLQLLTIDQRRVNVQMARSVKIGELRALVGALMPSANNEPVLMTVKHTQVKLSDDEANAAEVAEGAVIVCDRYIP